MYLYHKYILSVKHIFGRIVTFICSTISSGETWVYWLVYSGNSTNIFIRLSISGRFQLAPDTSVELSNILSLNNIFGNEHECISVFRELVSNIFVRSSISVGEFQLACDPLAELSNILSLNNIFGRNMSVLVYSGNSYQIYSFGWAYLWEISIGSWHFGRIV